MGFRDLAFCLRLFRDLRFSILSFLGFCDLQASDVGSRVQGLGCRDSGIHGWWVATLPDDSLPGASFLAIAGAVPNSRYNASIMGGGVTA